MTRFITGVPTYLEIGVVTEAVNQFYGITSASAYRFSWNNKPGQTIKVEIPDADSTNVKTEDQWISIDHVFVQISEPRGSQRRPILQCSACYRFGHGHLKCRNTAVCSSCSLTLKGHICDGTLKCVNCGGSHENTSIKCPKRTRLRNDLTVTQEYRPTNAPN